MSKFECVYRTTEAFVLATEFCIPISSAPLLPHAQPPPEDKRRTAGGWTGCRRSRQVASSSAASLHHLIRHLVTEPHSRLIRVGFLEKMSSQHQKSSYRRSSRRRQGPEKMVIGFQPRIALLFSDRLVYCGRVSGSTTMQLKVSHNASSRIGLISRNRLQLSR